MSYNLDNSHQKTLSYNTVVLITTSPFSDITDNLYIYTGENSQINLFMGKTPCSPDIYREMVEVITFKHTFVKFSF